MALRRFLVATTLGLLLVPGVAAASAASPQDVPGTQSGYVGMRECVSCHAEQARGYRGTPHARAWDDRTPAAAQACETCHGPGKGHIDDPGDKTRIVSFLRMAPRAVSEKCQSCHQGGDHAQWQGSMHDTRNVSCISCHSVHTPQSERAQLKKVSVTATCAQCHRDKAARLLRSNHMPVREGKLECTTCHNQHGSTNVRLLRVGNSVNEFCASCHAEKRGPFLWDHPPVRENCNTCHDPHGTSNERLLVARPPMLCQRCHVAAQHPSTVYDAAAIATNRNVHAVGRGCVNCHSNIHGSNHPAGFRFQR